MFCEAKTNVEHRAFTLSMQCCPFWVSGTGTLLCRLLAARAGKDAVQACPAGGC